MGTQSQEIKNLLSEVVHSKDNLRKVASNEYNFKYFSFEECCDKPDGKLNFLIKKYFNPSDNNMITYFNKRMNGTLDNEYKRHKILNVLGNIEFDWECVDMEEDVGACCDWKSIDW